MPLEVIWNKTNVDLVFLILVLLIFIYNYNFCVIFWLVNNNKERKEGRIENVN